MSKINPVLTSYNYENKSKYLKYVDKALSPVFGRKIEIIQSAGESSYNVETRPMNIKKISLIFALSITFVIPVCLFLKAVSTENRNIAKQVSTLQESAAAVQEVAVEVEEVAQNTHDESTQTYEYEINLDDAKHSKSSWLWGMTLGWIWPEPKKPGDGFILVQKT